jgi:hypothetical protein
MAQHVFIVMPSREKEGINFNQIHLDLIKPAFLEVGWNPTVRMKKYCQVIFVPICVRSY